MRVLDVAKRTAALYVMFALAFGGGACAASFATVLTEKGRMIALKGDIAREDANMLETLIRSAQAEGQTIIGLQLDSSGGNLLGGMRLARLVRGHGDLSTAVSYGATCTSACFLVFAAGRDKFVDYGSSVGVHAASDPAGAMTDETAAATRAMAYLCRQLGVPVMITEKLVATPPGEITWLTLQDFQSMGVTMIGQPIQDGWVTGPQNFSKSSFYPKANQTLSSDIK